MPLHSCRGLAPGGRSGPLYTTAQSSAHSQPFASVGPRARVQMVPVFIRRNPHSQWPCPVQTCAVRGSIVIAAFLKRKKKKHFKKHKSRQKKRVGSSFLGLSCVTTSKGPASPGLCPSSGKGDQSPCPAHLRGVWRPWTRKSFETCRRHELVVLYPPPPRDT